MVRIMAWLSRRAAISGAACVAALGIVAGVAYATIPDSNHVFTACMLNNVGTIRMIGHDAKPARDPAGHCSGLETLLTWNQCRDKRALQAQLARQGPKGDTGPAGPCWSGIPALTAPRVR